MNIKSCQECIEKIKKITYDGSKNEFYELPRLKKLFEECLNFTQKHNNNVGNYYSKKQFGKNINELNIGELMILGFCPENITREHAEEQFRILRSKK